MRTSPIQSNQSKAKLEMGKLKKSALPDYYGNEDEDVLSLEYAARRREDRKFGRVYDLAPGETATKSNKMRKSRTRQVNEEKLAAKKRKKQQRKRANKRKKQDVGEDGEQENGTTTTTSSLKSKSKAKGNTLNDDRDQAGGPASKKRKLDSKKSKKRKHSVRLLH
eukprot:TRINITY_DN8576_c0_g1_i1.p3 TRINITY_DN8576_c0_g1~~TRINITY_DN8576_c0_g1_i1.p3  ORF type:complete len:165 (-),score=56.40 TRINITY_DN8576_c0_g1_i1:709-1203(-)